MKEGKEEIEILQKIKQHVYILVHCFLVSITMIHISMINRVAEELENTQGRGRVCIDSQTAKCILSSHTVIKLHKTNKQQKTLWELNCLGSFFGKCKLNLTTTWKY